ncbi:hypothetical protein ILUMI_22457 [Ignelater luminosus]|uniref:Lipase domain-containing protein n=1 Tax=Ignelater luminosus TaxID=2038154 RepID=A0A8K0G0I5_IGNLU|nr:hypothetical protein ILUMI_22457 [Ignelater luminosus]
MSKLVSFIVLCTALNSVTAKDSYCYGNITFGNIPFTIQELIADVLLKSIPATFFTDCSNVNIPIANDSIKFYFFNSTSSYVRIDSDNPPQLDPSKRLIILAHGWLCSMNDSYFPDLRQAYFKRYGDCNIIGVDWSDLSVNVWSIAYCSVPIVGAKLGDLLCKIASTSGIPVESMHMVGHSMGGQMAGFTGQRVQTQCGSKIGNITALDPGGISYQVQLDESKRLDKGDGIAVQVIHTNAGILGYEGNCGTTDFYPNCGTIQPGCLDVIQALKNAALLWPNNPQAILNNSLVNLPLTEVLCDHFRSIVYFIESVNSKQFKAIDCKKCTSTILDSLCLLAQALNLADYTIMGEDCPPVNEEDAYFLTTNSKSPFAKGDAGA